MGKQSSAGTALEYPIRYGKQNQTTPAEEEKKHTHQSKMNLKNTPYRDLLSKKGLEKNDVSNYIQNL